MATLLRHVSALVVFVCAVPALAVSTSAAKDELYKQNEQGQEIRLDARAPNLNITSNLLVGNKGEESLDVSVLTECGVKAWVFNHAEIVVHRNRYGQAQFTGLPQKGCRKCAPISVRWFHEPTGYLEFDVNVYRRQVRVDCD